MSVLPATVKNGIVQRVNGLVILPFYETRLSNVVQWIKQSIRHLFLWAVPYITDLIPSSLSS